MESITYHPSTGQIHKGDTTHIDTRDNFSSEVLASVDIVPKSTQVASVGECLNMTITFRFMTPRSSRL